MNALGPRLPTELVDAVIDNALEGCLFSDDFSGLSSYALVGRLVARPRQLGPLSRSLHLPRRSHNCAAAGTR